MSAKLERLMNLSATLLATTRPLSADEVVARVSGYPDGEDAMHRAFERDKEDLRDLGIPLALDEIPGSDPPRTGYWIRSRDYYLDDPGFLPDERAALELATSLVRVDGDRAAAGWWKLGGLSEAADAAVELTEVPGDPNVARCVRAVATRARTSFGYQGERRRVDPLQVQFTRGRWYLVGHDLDRGARRNFRFDRVDGPVEVGAPGTAEAPLPAAPPELDQPWTFGQEEAVQARLLVDADQAPFAVREVGDDAVVARHPDGSVELVMTVTNRAAFRSFALSFLDHAEVLGPPELRDDVVAWLGRVAESGRS